MQRNNQALLLVDLQMDFFPGGALAVPKADQVFPLANDLQDFFSLVIASQDWHPSNHKSFASQHAGHQVFDVIDLHGFSQVLWPDHCVQGSLGAAFHPTLRKDRIDKIVYKGTDPDIDSYSTFFDNEHRKDTGLHLYLKEKQINTLYIMGLATDYCVLYSVLDARALGFNTIVIVDGCYGIEKNPGDIQLAFEKMVQAGAKLIHSQDIQQGTDV